NRERMSTRASRRPGLSETRFRLIVHPTCVIKPAVDGCPLVAANSMEIEKVRSFLLQIREKDHAAPLGGIVRVIRSPPVVFPKQHPSCLFPHHVPTPSRSAFQNEARRAPRSGTYCNSRNVKVTARLRLKPNSNA